MIYLGSRVSGRVRQVGPPAPLTLISIPSVLDDLDAGAFERGSRRGLPAASGNAGCQREHVGAHGLELLVGNLDEAQPSIEQPLAERYRHQR